MGQGKFDPRGDRRAEGKRKELWGRDNGRVREGPRGGKGAQGLDGDTENGSHGTTSRREFCPKWNWA